MNTERANEILALMHSGLITDIGPEWQARMREALERVIELEKFVGKIVESGPQTFNAFYKEAKELL